MKSEGDKLREIEQEGEIEGGMERDRERVIQGGREEEVERE